MKNRPVAEGELEAVGKGAMRKAQGEELQTGRPVLSSVCKNCPYFYGFPNSLSYLKRSSRSCLQRSLKPGILSQNL